MGDAPRWDSAPGGRALRVGCLLLTVLMAVWAPTYLLSPSAPADRASKQRHERVERRDKELEGGDAMELKWSGGGVVSATAAEELKRLRDLTVATLRLENRNATEAACEAVRNGWSLRRYVEDLTVAMLYAPKADDDCLFHITPASRAMCAILELIDDSKTFSEQWARVYPHKPTRFVGVFEQSLCAEFLACQDWARGRLRLRRGRSSTNGGLGDGVDTAEPSGMWTPVTTEALHHVYATEVMPMIKALRDDKLSQQNLLHNFLHGEGEWNELQHWASRSAAMLLDQEKRDNLVRLKGNMNKAPPSWRSPTPVLDVFQGKVLEFDKTVSREGWLVSNERKRDTDGGDSQPRHAHDGGVAAASSFSPLQLLALLVHHNVRTRREALTGARDAPPGRHLVVFQGDSTVRELFARFIHHIRYGTATRSTNDGHRIRRPFYDRAFHSDCLYTVCPSSDEVLVINQWRLPSDMVSGTTANAAAAGGGDGDAETGVTNSTSSHPGDALHRQSNRTAAEFRDVESNSRFEVLHRILKHRVFCASDQPLLQVLFLWDTHSAHYRNDPLMHVRGLPRSSSTRWNASTLREMGFGISLHVEGQTQWERTRGADMMNHWSAVAAASVGSDRIDMEEQESSSGRHHHLVNNTSLLELKRTLKQVTLDVPSGPTLQQDGTLVYMLTGTFEDKMSQMQLHRYGPRRVWRSMPPGGVATTSPRMENHIASMTKNLHHLQWIAALDTLRREGHGKRATEQPRTPRYVKSIKILDKAKIVYIPGIRSHDRFHMSCRCDRVFYDHLFRSTITVRRMLQLTASIAIVKAEEEPSAETGTFLDVCQIPFSEGGGGGRSGGIEKTNNVSESTLAASPSSAPEATAASPVLVPRSNRMWTNEYVRRVEWVLARKRNYHFQLMHRTAVKGNNGLPFHGGKDYCGVVESDDGCADYADFGLMQIVLMDVALQQAQGQGDE